MASSYPARRNEPLVSTPTKKEWRCIGSAVSAARAGAIATTTPAAASATAKTRLSLTIAPLSAVGRHGGDPDEQIPAAIRSLLATGLRRGPMKEDVSIPAWVHVGPGPPEVGFPEAGDVLRERGRLGGRARYVDTHAGELRDERFGLELDKELLDGGRTPGDLLEVVLGGVFDHVRHQHQHFSPGLVVKQLLSDQERAEDVGVRARVTPTQDVRDLCLDLSLQVEDPRPRLLRSTVGRQDHCPAHGEFGLGRQDDLDEGPELGEGLVMDGGHQKAIPRRE